MLEKYQNMPDYSNNQSFMNRFFIPVVKKAWNGLLPGGKMALNMPEAMYDELIHSFAELPKATKIEMKLSTKHPTKAFLMKSLKNDERIEYIYVWNKI